MLCVVPIAGPAITEDKPHRTVPVQERSDPSLMGFVQHSAMGQIHLVFRDKHHLEQSYERTLIKFILDRIITLVEGHPVVFVPKYENSSKSPDRHLINRLQRRAMKKSGLAWHILSSALCVQVHVACLASFRQWLETIEPWCPSHSY